MKKENTLMIIGITVLLAIVILLCVLMNKTYFKKNLSYYVNSVSYVKTDKGNFVMYSLTNNSENDGKIAYASYETKDENDKVMESGIVKIDSEFKAGHRHMIKFKVNNLDFASISFKPLYPDKSEIAFIDNDVKLKYKEFELIAYDMNGNNVKIDILPQKSISVNEFQLIVYNEKNEEIDIKYLKESTDLTKGKMHKVNFENVDRDSLAATNAKLYYR